MSPKQLFYSYSHKDENLREELEEHLSLLRNQEIISEWHDRKIIAGEEWADEIDQNLKNADIILLLISSSFNDSDYCYKKEMKLALELHDSGQAVVIPVILRDCDWDSAPYGKLQALPKDGNAVTGSYWHSTDKAFKDVANGIRKATQKKTTVKTKIFDVPFNENPAFTGRENELKNLRSRLTSGGRTALTQAIRGLGGIGKTQIAVQYAYQYQAEYEFVFWVQLTDEEKREQTDPLLLLLNSYVGYCEKLSIPFDQTEAETAIPAFKNWLEQHHNWLLIFDNADQPNSLERFLPLQSQGHILLTSRASVFDTLQILEPIEVDKLPLDQATAFLIKRVARELNESEQTFVRELAEELDRLPLALEQAGAYLHRKKASTFENYLRRYRESKLTHLKQQGPVLGQYSKSLEKTWLINFQEIEEKEESQASADVLRFCAFLAPDSIPIELIRQGAHYLNASIQRFIEETGNDVSDLLEPLLNYSLIQMVPGKNEFSIHRLVQEVMKSRVDSQDEQSIWQERVVNCVNKIYPWPKHGNWQVCRSLAPQCMVANDYINQFKIETENSRSLLGKQANYFYQVGEYEEAEPLYLQAMEISRTVLGENHPDFATSLNNLASLYTSQGRYEEAEPLYLQAKEIRRTVLGENHPSFATSLNNLAFLYENQGRYEEAEPLYQQAKEIRRTVLGENHPSFATNLNNLAGLYQNQGRYEEAEPLHQQAMEIRRTVLGENHPDFATSLNNLAELYRSQGCYEEAEPLFLKDMEIRRTVLGENHPDFATSLNNLAVLYKSQGRYEEAEPLHQQAMEIRRTVLGENHPDFATSLNNLAILYENQGRYEEAEPLHQQAMEIRPTVLGENHPDFATSLNDLAGLYQNQGRYEEAEPLHLKAMEIRRTVLGENHPDFATSLNNLAGLYENQGRYEEAETLYLKAMEIFTSTLGSEHPKTKTVRKNYQHCKDAKDGRNEDTQ
ncbi:FxSxx-COOH system tetratricopeptide repeat protein [Gimesia aquarii]|uniref:Regulatory protein AfsR n=1 Tax=Gimesia aquarii TaxID=2527964 RepID=A0A517VTF5_9PLAN|nr:FxSxx-COOH system tetratricopeptide repeat protein [Gimesia aquarii]QDT96282.1 Regulatory protein AfsR [Gimesia aquarii]